MRSRRAWRYRRADQGGRKPAARACGFPFTAVDDGWLRRNPRLLDAALAACDALAPTLPLFAVVSCTIDSLTHRDERLSIVNRFAHGEPDGYWVGIAGAEGSTPEQLASAIDLILMLQQLGAPCIWTLPGQLAELAWSVGIAGAELPLGRAGGFRLPATGQTFRRVDRAPRFEFSSIMTSLPAALSGKLLDSGLLPESDCRCVSCRAASSTEERLAAGNAHNLSHWFALRDTLTALSADARVERYEGRLLDAADHLRKVRAIDTSMRSLRHVTHARRTFDVVLGEGILKTWDRLRRSA